MKFRFLLFALLSAMGMQLLNAGQFWRKIAQPTTMDLLRLSFVDSTCGWVAGREGVIFKTTNSGRDWAEQNSGVTGDIREFFALNAQYAWAISWVDFVDTSTFFGVRILKTTDGGSTWNSDTFPITGKYFHTITFFDSLHGWLGGEHGLLYETLNGGITWEQAPVDTTIASFLAILNIRFYSKEIGFAMGGAMDYAGVVWKTTNRGQSWSAGSVAPEPVYEMHFIDSLNIIGIVGDYDFGASMIRTSDGGNQWEYTYLEIFGQPRAMSFRTANEGWVPVVNQIMATYDTARTWNVVETLGFRQLADLAFTDSLIGYAVADSGIVFKYDHRTTGLRENAKEFLASAQLFQNYPNPFNPATTIKFSVGAYDHTSLRVYDMLGREIATLVNDKRLPGEYAVVWDARAVASGVYCCRLSVGSFIAAKKFVLIR